MAETEREVRAWVAKEAEKAFAEHVVTELRPWVWRCARPASWTYGFHVALLPGCVVITGDVGDAIFRMSEGREANVLAWLRGVTHHGDWGYLLGKLTDHPKDFYAGDALAYLAEVEKEARERLAEGPTDRGALRDLEFAEAAREAGDMSEHTWAELVSRYGHGDPDTYGVGRGEAARSYWLAEALRAFMRLLDKSLAKEEPSGDSRNV